MVFKYFNEVLNIINNIRKKDLNKLKVNHKILHIIPVAIKGGPSIIQKYLDYKKHFEKIGVDYKLIIIIPKGFHQEYIGKIINDPKIYIIKSKFVNKKCIFKRTMMNALTPLDEIITIEKPTNIILRLGMIDSSYMRFIKKYMPIIEQASAPLEINFINAPLYKKLAKKYMPKVFQYTKLMTACLRYFKEFYPSETQKLYILNNSVDISKYKPKKYHNKGKSSYNILLMSNIYSKYTYCGYDRLLKGLQKYLRTNKPDKKINIYVLGSDIDGFKELLKYHKIFLPKTIVQFHFLGFRTISQINKIIGKIDLGINDLAAHRQGIKSVSALKTNDFLGWHLPFIISGDDENIFKYKEGFYKKFKIGEENIDFKEVLHFIDNFTKKDYLNMIKCKKNSSLEKRLQELIDKIENVYYNK